MLHRLGRLPLEVLTSGNRILRNAIQAKQDIVGVEEISVTISPLTSGCLTSEIAK